MAQISIQDLTFCYDGGSENVFDGVSDICPSAEEWMIMREADLLELDADALSRPFCELSNGERTKLLLAGLFLTEDGFFLIDEPTNQLYRYLFAVANRAAFVRVLPDDDIRRA